MQFEDEIKMESLQGDERLSKAEIAVARNPCDIESWNALLRHLQERNIEEVRLVFEGLLSNYPNYAKVWKAYIEHETRAKCYKEVEKLFQRCLLNVIHIDIWRLYLNYIEEAKADQPQYKEKMVKAYEFAIDKIGTDINSYSVWVEYVNYLKSVEAVGSYAENQKIMAVRKVYQKGILNPMVGIDLLWKDYCNFENSINPQTAKKLQEEKNKDYQQTKRVTKEFEGIIKGIIRNGPSVLPSNTPEEIRQVELWKKYIQWEKSNPLKLQEADQAIITKRVMYTYEQCFLCLGLHPDVWIEAASFLEDSSKMLNERGANAAGKMFSEEASNIYERALSMGLKNCLLIYFAYADLEENRMKYDKVHSIYKRALELKDVETTLVYIQYMRFARRAEGIESSRVIFRQAREDPRTKYHVYVTAARLEHHTSKENGVALRIFELAFKRFGDQPEFLKEFLDYSMNVNDNNNTRVLYEKVINSGAESLDVWNKFVEFESNHGGLSNIFNTERRRLESFGKEFEGRETSLMVDRYKFLDLMPCSSEELKVIGYKPSCSNSNISQGDNDIDFQGHLRSSQKRNFYAPEVSSMTPFLPDADHEDNDSVPENSSAISFRLSNILGIGFAKTTNFVGPFARIDKLMESLSKLQIPKSEELKATKLSTESDSKRKRTEDDDDDYDDQPQRVYNNPFQARHHNKL